MEIHNNEKPSPESQPINGADHEQNSQGEPVKEIHHHHYDCKDRRPEFNFGKFFLGFFLVLLGLAYLAKNAGWLPANFNINVRDLWPLLIIVAGLSLLSGRNWTVIILGLILTFLIIALVGALIVTGYLHGGFMMRTF